LIRSGRTSQPATARVIHGGRRLHRSTGEVSGRQLTAAALAEAGVCVTWAWELAGGGAGKRGDTAGHMFMDAGLDE